MPIEIKKEIELELEIAHVLFIDIVAYLKFSINEQRAAVAELNEIVRTSEQFQKAEAAARLIKIPTGNGMALVFYTSPEAPVQCAIEISRALKQHPRLQLRMGVRSVPVSGVIDVNGHANLAGAGLNIPQWVMVCGDAGHILISKHVAEDLEEYEYWRPLLHAVGECEVKHGVRVAIVNLYVDEVGNPQLPKKFQALKKHSARVRWTAITAALLVLAVIVAGGAMFSRYRVRSTLAASEKSIAVLPFVNMSADEGDEYLSDGVSEELITALSKITGLQVKARTSSFAFKGKNEDIQKIGELLHVSHLLEGSVARAGNKLRVAARPIQASDGNHLWSDTYDREMQDIFAVRSEVAQQVAETLKIRLLGEDKKRLDKKPTENIEAYNLYRQRRYYAERFSQDSFKKALGFYQQAIGKDPRFALAYAGIADTYVLAADYCIPLREAFSNAKEAALKAIELDDNLAEAHASLGFVHFHYDWDWAAAEKEFKRALTLNPQSARAHIPYTEYLTGMGRITEACDQGRQALEIDPVSPLANGNLGWAFMFARDSGTRTKAFEWLEKAYQERSDSLAWFRKDPESKSLQADPRFAVLMRKIGFTEP